MAVCPRCSAKVVPGDDVCKACGRRLPHALTENDETDPMIGRTIADKYEVVELLGEGAMGRVYEARQLALEKDVAIKVLHAHLANDPKVKKRFHREARAASRLSHPNSLHIIDFGEDDDGTLYIAMELLDGDDLLAVIEHDAPLTPRRIYDIMRQVLSALETAHHAGIIHRDLKPENVVVLESPSGEEHVKVCDFGIAKIQEAEGGSAITVTGFVCGTPEYMAPEQARGEELDNRADLYAAGCMLYQMLTASIPFTAESALGIITKHLTERPVSPRDRRPEWKIPRALERVCLKGMMKDREARYASAAEMSEDLKRAVATLGDLADQPLGAFQVEEDDEVVASPSEAEAEAERSTTWALVLVVLGAAAVALALYSAPTDEAAGPDGGAQNLVQTATPPTLGVTPDAAPQPDGDDAAVDAGARDSGSADSASASAQSRPPDSGRAVTTSPAGMRRRPRERPTDAAAAMAPASETPGQAAYREGRARFRASDVDGAITLFEEAARLMPRDAQVQKQLGRAYMRAGNPARGTRAYRRYLELAPNAADREIIESILDQAE